MENDTSMFHNFYKFIQNYGVALLNSLYHLISPTQSCLSHICKEKHKFYVVRDLTLGSLVYTFLKWLIALIIFHFNLRLKFKFL